VFVILPLLTFCAFYLYIFGRWSGNELAAIGWREPFLQSCLAFGGLVTVFSELLSPFNALSSFGLILLWGFALSTILLFGWRQGTFHRAWSRVKHLPWSTIRLMEWLILVALMVFVGLLFVIAYKAVPNTTDSLLYHMSRVVHWAQNASLKHYATQYHHQILTPIWAETMILHLRLLWGNDQLAGLVQWFSMVGSLIGVSAIAGLLGAGRKEQLLASVFTAGIPMGILQSTSTQNDYVVAFWLVCMVYFMLLGKKKELTLYEWLSLGAATGLGMLTKGTFYIYAFPFLLWFFIPRLKELGWRRVVREGILIATIIVALNAGFWARNLITYQEPLGPGKWLSDHIEVQFNPRMWLPEVAKHVAINFASTIKEVNDFLISSVRSISTLFGVKVQNFGAFPWWNWNHEDLAGSPLHMFSVFITFFVLALSWRRKEIRLAFRYALITLSAFFFISITLEFNSYIVRFHLPFFVLWGAVFGSVAYYVDFKRLTYVAAVLIFIAAGPWLIMNRTRCLFAYVPYTNLGRSVLREQPDKILFANWHPLREPYNAITEAVKKSGCTDVGLKIDSSDLEYPFWRLLEAPQSGYRIESIEVRPQLERYVDPDFKPCAIICTICGDREQIHGLEQVGDFGEGLLLYAGSDYTTNEDG
jgi:4-amino-4-deoxy-L-arabinose transferase-like glycosyltransferase